MAGRDVRVAQTVASSATRTARATREVVTALQPMQTGPPTQASIQRAADALVALHATLHEGRRDPPPPPRLTIRPWALTILLDGKGMVE